MANSIYNQLNNNISNNLFQNPQFLLNQINEFKKTLQGNPQKMVMQLLQSGRMSQQDYNQYRQMTSQIRQNFYGN